MNIATSGKSPAMQTPMPCQFSVAAHSSIKLFWSFSFKNNKMFCKFPFFQKKWPPGTKAGEKEFHILKINILNILVRRADL
ncbi:MAG: hypothetical protein K6A65_06660 [Succinivibrionaceae bacterium]|nr:hypothetical protein [Succinivibrionaceae bacterium]